MYSPINPRKRRFKPPKKKTDTIKVLVNKEPKVKIDHINEIVRIATEDKFHGGCKCIKQKLANHSDDAIKISLSEKTIGKILRKKKNKKRQKKNHKSLKTGYTIH
mgnify:CR=1 FL=1